MKIEYHDPATIVGQVSAELKALQDAGKAPKYVDLTVEEYAQLKTDIGAPQNAVVGNILGLPLMVDGKPSAEQAGGRIITA